MKLILQEPSLNFIRISPLVPFDTAHVTQALPYPFFMGNQQKG